jgi:Flp pilus assembly protein protease CpaA
MYFVCNTQSFQLVVLFSFPCFTSVIDPTFPVVRHFVLFRFFVICLIFCQLHARSLSCCWLLAGVAFLSCLTIFVLQRALPGKQKFFDSNTAWVSFHHCRAILFRAVAFCGGSIIKTCDRMDVHGFLWYFRTIRYSKCCINPMSHL